MYDAHLFRFTRKGLTRDDAVEAHELCKTIWANKEESAANRVLALMLLLDLPQVT